MKREDRQSPLRGPRENPAAAQPLAALPLRDAAYPLRVSGFRGERRRKEAGAVFAARRKRSLADFATTRRMPSDADWALWRAELETLG